MIYPIELETFVRHVRKILGNGFTVELCVTPNRKFGIVIEARVGSKYFETSTYFPLNMSPEQYCLSILQAFERAKYRAEGKEPPREYQSAPIEEIALEEIIPAGNA